MKNHEKSNGVRPEGALGGRVSEPDQGSVNWGIQLPTACLVGI